MLQLLAFAACLAAAEPEQPANEPDIGALVDQLVEVSEAGMGYGGRFGGSEFLPYDGTESMGPFVIGGTARAKSETLKLIVEQGVRAVPVLLEHIGDERTIALPPIKGMMWTSYNIEYDRNRRTDPPVPDEREAWFAPGAEPGAHAVTVGDLCFVALGQIVNRGYSAVRYQPTAGVVVSSPTHFPELRERVRADWGGLTAERHRLLLIKDFEQCDSEYRQIGAYYRLAYYYPETVEPLVLARLARPTYDVFAINEFCRDVLYKTEGAEARKAAYARFIEERGAHWETGVLIQLYGDLDYLEADEERRVSPPLTEFRTQPREILVEVFGMPATVRSTDAPLLVSEDFCVLARFIEALVHDDSRKVTEAVIRYYEKHRDDDYTALACLTCLVGRGEMALPWAALGDVDLREQGWSEAHYNATQLIDAVGRSDDPEVPVRFAEMLSRTTNDRYFEALLAHLGGQDPEAVFGMMMRILDAVPPDSEDGGAVLAGIVERYPDRAPDVVRNFLKPGTVERAHTVVMVLWYGSPWSCEILGPMLDDQRMLEGMAEPMRLCDRAATALSHAARAIRFDSDWPLAERDRVIAQLKEYCRGEAAGVPK